MAFYRKPPWHCFEIGIVIHKRRPIFHLGRWVWNPRRPKPDFGDCLFGVLWGEEPSAEFKERLPALGRLIKEAERLFVKNERRADEVEIPVGIPREKREAQIEHLC